MVEISVDAKVLSAVKLFAANDADRPHLSGVAVEVNAGWAYFIATDNRALMCARTYADQPNLTDPVRVLIPNQLLKTIKGAETVNIVIGEPPAVTSNARPVSITAQGLTVRGETLDAGFPQWRRVIPKSVSGQPAQFNLELLGTIGKAAALLSKRRKGVPEVRIAYNGQAPALLDFGRDDIFGVVMPLHEESWRPSTTPPVWFMPEA